MGWEWENPEEGGAPGRVGREFKACGSSWPRWKPLLNPSGASKTGKRNCLKRKLNKIAARLNYTLSGTPLSGAAGFNRLFGGRHNGRQGAGVGGMKSAQDFIGRVLQPCVRLVQLAGCLASQLTQLVTVGDVRKCSKNKIGTHSEFLLQHNLCQPELYRRRQCGKGSLRLADRPKVYHSRTLDARSGRRVHNHGALSHNVEQA